MSQAADQQEKTTARVTTSKPWDAQSTLSSADTLCSTTQSIPTKQAETKNPSVAKKAWTAMKKHAKEHHESVNAAYAAYYGLPATKKPVTWEADKKQGL